MKTLKMFPFVTKVLGQKLSSVSTKSLAQAIRLNMLVKNEQWGKSGRHCTNMHWDGRQTKWLSNGSFLVSQEMTKESFHSLKQKHVI